MTTQQTLTIAVYVTSLALVTMLTFGCSIPYGSRSYHDVACDALRVTNDATEGVCWAMTYLTLALVLTLMMAGCSTILNNQDGWNGSYGTRTYRDAACRALAQTNDAPAERQR